jgi:hypothetical protein
LSILLFLNELSCGTPQPPDRVDEVMEGFVALLRHVRHRRNDAALVSPVRREQLELAQAYYVNQWIGAKPRNRELWRVFQNMQNRAPYSDVLPPGGADATEYTVHGRKAVGLGAAHLMDGLLVSLLVDPVWDTTRIEAICDEISADDDEIRTSKVEVRHAATVQHMQVHDAWLGSAGLSSLKTGTEIWDEWADLYPKLQYLPGVRDQLRDLYPHWVIPVADHLRTLNDAVAEWDPTAMPEPRWKTKVTPEHQNRKSLCRFEDLDGEQRIFDLHARFTPGAGRIHLRLIPEEQKARIAYIGLKLGI